MDVVGGVERMYDARQFPVPRYPATAFLAWYSTGIITSYLSLRLLVVRGFLNIYPRDGERVL